MVFAYAAKTDIEALRKQIEEDEKAKSSLLDILQSVQHTSSATKAIISRIEELEKSISGCKSELAKITQPVVVPDKNKLRTKIKDIIGLFERSDFEQKRGILQTFVKQLVLDPFNKCVIVEGYCDPLCTWKGNTKLNKKASDCSEAYDFASVQHGCGGRLLTWTHKIRDYRVA